MSWEIAYSFACLCQHFSITYSSVQTSHSPSQLFTTSQFYTFHHHSPGFQIIWMISPGLNFFFLGLHTQLSSPHQTYHFSLLLVLTQSISLALLFTQTIHQPWQLFDVFISNTIDILPPNSQSLPFHQSIYIPPRWGTARSLALHPTLFVSILSCHLQIWLLLSVPNTSPSCTELELMHIYHIAKWT